MQKIRNFSIIAHIDHGKSTLADRFMQITGLLSEREMKHGQMLDTMDIEQERGITIKLQPVTLHWKGYELNIIDTPGHVDFQYEVSRSLAACEGAILVVDASQGIEAQTLANVYLAIENNLEIIPVINKIDLPAADVEKVANEIINLIGCKREDIIPISAKTGENVETVLDAVIEIVPSPDESGLRVEEGIDNDNETKALIFDSIYDQYKGILAFVRIISGEIKRGTKCKMLGTRAEMEVLEVGVFSPKYEKKDILKAGNVGYIVTGLRSTSESRVGDTVYSGENMENAKMLPGYIKVKPTIYAGIFCADTSDYNILRGALEKIQLNDAALVFDPVNSMALGNGFRCGCLGLLHLDILQERLEREFDLDLIISAPSVKYEIVYNDGKVEEIASAEDLPDPSYLREIREPIVKLEVIIPQEYTGAVMEICQNRRGKYQELKTIDEHRNMVVYKMPLATIIADFFDKLKSVTSGYASMNYEIIGYFSDKLVKMDFLIAGEKVDPLSIILHKDEAHNIGIGIAKKLKDVIPRAQFPIALQAAVGGTIVARETIPAVRKDVTAKLYGGDATRKNKLLEKQKKGKKRMREFGKVNLPQGAFMAVLKRD
ncbi:translation elongation factor 4 [Candidatus Gracilibacteria bacterium]|nr:translation elongation factor 4 [Candidatus Gracilibacteria bacterium]